MSFVSSLIHRLNYAPAWVIGLIIAIPVFLWILGTLELSDRGLLVGNAFLFAVSLTAVIAITVIWRTREALPKANLIPFSFISRGKEAPTVFREYGMNVCLFIPLGLTMPVVFNCKPWKAVLFGFCLSGVIEALQYVFALGLCEADDVIANTLGCLIGIIISCLSLELRRKYRRKIIRKLF